MRHLPAHTWTIAGTTLVVAALIVFGATALIGSGSEEAIAVSTMKSRAAGAVPTHKLAASLAYRCSVCLPR